MRRKLKLSVRDIDNLIYVSKRYFETSIVTARMDEELGAVIDKLVDEDYRRQTRRSFKFFGEQVLP